MKKIFCFLFVLGAVFNSLQAEISADARFEVPAEPRAVSTNQKFVVLTIPKSGTHLIKKLILMLTNRENNNTWYQPFNIGAIHFIEDNPQWFIDHDQLAMALNNVFEKNEYVIAHFNFGPHLKTYFQSNPDCIPLIQIRDLRDACVSCVFMCKDAIAKEIGTYNFDQQLMYVITMGQKVPANRILNIYRNAEEAVYWYKRPDTVVCRFEHLVGKKGGGTLEEQQLQVLAVAQALNIELDAASLNWICHNLFGIFRGPQMESTFRKGQIGSWKQYFKYSHREAFKQYMGHLQIALGYPLED